MGVYFTLDNLSFLRLRENAVIQDPGNEFVPIANVPIIIDFGVAQCWISEDLVVIEPRIGGKTTASLVTAEGEQMEITSVTPVICICSPSAVTNDAVVFPPILGSITTRSSEIQHCATPKSMIIGTLAIGTNSLPGSWITAFSRNLKKERLSSVKYTSLASEVSKLMAIAVSTKLACYL